MTIVFCTAPTSQECECFECGKTWVEPGDYDFNYGIGHVFVPATSSTECPECREVRG